MHAARLHACRPSPARKARRGARVEHSRGAATCLAQGRFHRKISNDVRFQRWRLACPRRENVFLDIQGHSGSGAGGLDKAPPM